MLTIKSINYIKMLLLGIILSFFVMYGTSCTKGENPVTTEEKAQQAAEKSKAEEKEAHPIDAIIALFPNQCYVHVRDTLYISDVENNYLYRVDIHSKEKTLVDNTLKVTEISVKDNKLYYMDKDRQIKKSISLNKSTGKPEGDIVTDIYEAMALEDKIGQLFIVAFRHNKQGNNLQVLDEETKDMISKYHFGGIILFSENIHSDDQTKQLIEDMQKASKIPCFIAVDEEGGKVSRLTKSPYMSMPKLNGNAVIGESGNVQEAYNTGKLIANHLTALGFNLDFAPVADINTNPDNPVIGERAFGSDPQLVAEMTAAMTRGLQENGISATLKHFPGHGDTSLDTHTGAVSVNHTLERLCEVEFVPFKRGIEIGADAVMTAHIMVPEVTGDEIPATFSSYMLTEILRKELGHRKLIITDSLEMAAVTNFYTPKQAAVEAIKAGADILLIPLDIDEAYHGIYEAVKTGEIPEERIDESVIRILRVKQERNIIQKSELK